MPIKPSTALLTVDVYGLLGQFITVTAPCGLMSAELYSAVAGKLVLFALQGHSPEQKKEDKFGE